jgi:hypothetical protein
MKEFSSVALEVALMGILVSLSPKKRRTNWRRTRIFGLEIVGV